MSTCGPVTKSLLLLAVVVALTGQGSAAKKFSECCTKVSAQRIPETIVDYMLQKRNYYCVNAIIFQTKSGVLYCSKHDEPWVMRKVSKLRALKMSRAEKRLALASATAFLKLITSTSSPPPLEGTTGTPSTHYTVQ